MGGQIFLSIREIQKALLEFHGTGYAVVAVVIKGGVKIYDEPQKYEHPAGEEALESNLKGAGIMHGKERTILVRADAI